MGRKTYSIEFKHEVCKYYEHHTQKETVAKYGLSTVTICKWRAALGYRNKHRGYNIKTQDLFQVSKVKIKEDVKARSFKIITKENGELRAELLQSKLAMAVLEREYQELSSRIEKVTELLAK